ncbi:MAG: hypothetical protein ACQRW7_11360 [Caulobacterales bacterium]|uniref:hypothetical protein n=1 Tax=Glycocaulis sp. TaxID=1969725 RepID=UPI003FA0F4AC
MQSFDQLFSQSLEQIYAALGTDKGVAYRPASTPLNAPAALSVTLIVSKSAEAVMAGEYQGGSRAQTVTVRVMEKPFRAESLRLRANDRFTLIADGSFPAGSVLTVLDAPVLDDHEYHFGVSVSAT